MTDVKHKAGDYNLSYELVRTWRGPRYEATVWSYFKGASGHVIPDPVGNVYAGNLDRLIRKANRLIDKHRRSTPISQGKIDLIRV